MRRTPHLERRLARFESLCEEYQAGAGRRVMAGQAPRNKGVDCGPVKRGKPTHRWTLGHQKIRRLSREGDVQMKVSPSHCPRYLTLPALPTRLRASALARHPTWPRHRWRTSYPRAGHRPPRPRTEPQVRRPLKPMSSHDRRRSARRRSGPRERGDTAPRNPRLPAYRSTVETLASAAVLSRRATKDCDLAMAAATAVCV